MIKGNSLKKRIFAAVIAGTVGMSIAMSGCSIFQGNNTSGQQESNTESQTTSVEIKSKFGDNIALKSENFSMTLPIMTYLFNYNYNQYAQYAVYYYGLDQTKSLRDQYYKEDEGVTWYSYFMEMTKQYAQQLIVLSEAAKADGLDLDDSDKENIKSSIDSMKESAESSNISLEELIANNFSEGVTQADVENSMTLTALAQKYYDKVYNSFKYTNEQYEDFYNQHSTDYQFSDFMKFDFSFASDSSSGTSESSASAVDKDKKDEAKAFADDLAKCKTEKEFTDYINKYLSEHKDKVVADMEVSEGQTPSDNDINEKIKSMVSAAKQSKYAYEVTSEAGKWVFGSGRKTGDTHVFENSDSYTVLLMLKTAYRDESVNKNVRHILFKTETYGTDEAAKKKADEVYAKWQKGAKTEDSFAELANKYSEDPGSNTKGGLYENVYEGQMVPTFNDWVFDANRKVGDTGIVKTDYGYHIMFYSGESDPTWKVSVDTVMRRSDFEEEYTKLSEKYTVDFDDDYLNTIEIRENVEQESDVETPDISVEEDSQQNDVSEQPEASSEASATASAG